MKSQMEYYSFNRYLRTDSDARYIRSVSTAASPAQTETAPAARAAAFSALQAEAEILRKALNFQ